MDPMPTNTQLGRIDYALSQIRDRAELTRKLISEIEAGKRSAELLAARRSKREVIDKHRASLELLENFAEILEALHWFELNRQKKPRC